MPKAPALEVWTIGHSTRSIEEFLALLAAYRIETIADVRSFPGSRRYPQFGKQALRDTLEAHGIEYRWLPALGGRRQPAPDSPNVLWRNASFRGYADYMQTGEFADGLNELIALARGRRTAAMCSESLWWRCHRSMIADALLARGIGVRHILALNESAPHPWTAPARLVDGHLTYTADGTPPRSPTAPRPQGPPATR